MIKLNAKLFFIFFFLRMKLHYIVRNESGTASVISWDRQAMQLVGKSAREMKLKLDEASCVCELIVLFVCSLAILVMLYKLQEDRGYDFLEELDSVVTKRMVLSLKLNE